ncbi:MAG TPA: hypothetical protein VN677_09475 [Gemmatimonadaceae bacterium]|nr:hypothetical protein [Gemmatimonadaceae bacterium]
MTFTIDSNAADPMRTIVLMLAPALLLSAQLASAQQLPDKRTTETGRTVTVYAISWPTPTSDVVADVEVCTGQNTPPYTFAFPSFFQLHFSNGSAIGGFGGARKPNFEKTPLKSGQCARGWIEFAVTSGQTPVAIHYHERAKGGKAIDWAVKREK